MPRSIAFGVAASLIGFFWASPTQAQATGGGGNYFGKEGGALRVKVPVSGRVDTGTGLEVKGCGFSIISQSGATHKGQGIYSAKVSVAGNQYVIDGSQEVRVETERARCSITITIGKGSGNLYLAGSCECAP